MARRINLVPHSERARTRTNVGMLGIVAAAIVVLFAVGLGYYLLNNTLGERQDELSRVEDEARALQQQVSALNKYGALANDRERAEETVQAIYSGRTLVSDILDSLSLVMPENAWLDSLTVSAPDLAGAEVVGSGSLSLSGSTYSFEDVAQVLVRLQLIPALTQIDLQSAAGSDQGATGQGIKTFSVEAAINPPTGEALLPVSQVEVEGL